MGFTYINSYVEPFGVLPIFPPELSTVGDLPRGDISDMDSTTPFSVIRFSRISLKERRHMFWQSAGADSELC